MDKTEGYAELANLSMTTRLGEGNNLNSKPFVDLEKDELRQAIHSQDTLHE